MRLGNYASILYYDGAERPACVVADALSCRFNGRLHEFVSVHPFLFLQMYSKSGHGKRVPAFFFRPVAVRLLGLFLTDHRICPKDRKIT